MIQWIQTDEYLLENVEQNKYALDAPYSIKSNDDFAAK